MDREKKSSKVSDEQAMGEEGGEGMVLWPPEQLFEEGRRWGSSKQTDLRDPSLRVEPSQQQVPSGEDGDSSACCQEFTLISHKCCQREDSPEPQRPLRKDGNSDEAQREMDLRSVDVGSVKTQ